MYFFSMGSETKKIKSAFHCFIANMMQQIPFLPELQDALRLKGWQDYAKEPILLTSYRDENV